MKIAVGSDHAGYELKQKVLGPLNEKVHEVTDFGSYDPQPIDFPDIARRIFCAQYPGSL